MKWEKRGRFRYKAALKHQKEFHWGMNLTCEHMSWELFWFLVSWCENISSYFKDTIHWCGILEYRSIERTLNFWVWTWLATSHYCLQFLTRTDFRVKLWAKKILSLLICFHCQTWTWEEGKKRTKVDEWGEVSAGWRRDHKLRREGKKSQWDGKRN